MKLVERHIITEKKSYFNSLVDLCVKSTNLYNYATFCQRQHYFRLNNQNYTKDIFLESESNYLSYYEINRKFKTENQFDYRELPANIAQEVLKNMDQNWKSFFKLFRLKSEGKYKEQVNIPGYKKKQSRSLVILNVSTLSKTKSSFKLPKTDVTINGIRHLDRATQIRIVPKNGYIVLEVIYNKDENEMKEDNKRYLSIDLGQNNLCACSSNVMKSFLINGRPVKSINQYYNKILSLEKSRIKKENNVDYSNELRRFTMKRNNKIDWYFHNISKYIVDICKENDINVIVIGHNKQWKDEINLGKKTNQNFVFIPFSRLVNMIQYKAKLEGINVVLQEESYTSKASFIDNDFIPTYNKENDIDYKFSGKRKKRGLYVSKNGFKINADINGSLNILRKYLNVATKNILDVQSNSGLVVSPSIVGFY